MSRWGFGIIIGIIVLLGLMVRFETYKMFTNKLKNNFALVFICFILTVFAISNVVTFNDIILLEIPLPEFIINLCSIFRASSRMFYPVYYLIFFCVIITLWKYKDLIKKKNSYFLLIFIIVIQILDIGKCINQKHMAMQNNSTYASIIFSDDNLRKIAQNSSGVLLDNYAYDSRKIATWSYKNGLSTYFSVSNSGSYSECAHLAEKIIYKVRRSGDIGDNIIITSDINTAKFYEKFENIECYKKDNAYFLYKRGR